MSDWLTHFFRSFADQAAIWFIGVVLALFGVFSGWLTERIKFALNRADLRTKYYEEMAIDISHFVFIIDRINRVYYGSTSSDADRNAIANEYNEVMNSISRKEYVYLSWLQHYWGKTMAEAFSLTMEKIKAVDAVLIRLRDPGDRKNKLADLNAAFQSLQQAAHSLLVKTV